MSKVITAVHLSEWIAKNNKGNPKGTCTSAGNFLPNVISVREQGGYGVVNVRVGFDLSGESINSGWTTGNTAGVVKSTIIPYRKVVALCVRDQGGYGIVDVGVKVEGMNDVYWVTRNPNGNIKEVSLGGNTFLGFQGKEQAPYGIVDLRAIFGN